MPVETIFDKQYTSLFYDSDHKIVHHVFKPGIPGEDLREVLSAGVDLLAKHGATKWYADIRGFSQIGGEDGEWVTTVWLENAVNAGWQHWALIVPESDEGRLMMIEFVKAFTNRGVNSRMFTDPDKGMEWIKGV